MKILFKLILIATLLSASGVASAQSVDDVPLTEREELIVTALEALLGAMPDRAFPLAQKVLNGDHRDSIKSRALFVISQIDLPEAQALMLEYARHSNSDLSSVAIRNIGISGNAQGLQALGDIYANGDEDVRHHVLQAYMIAGDTQSVFDIAANAESDEEFEAAARMLGVMGASDELRQLVRNGSSTESLVQAYAIAGDLQGLMELAESAASANNPELRVSAISSIGIIGGHEANQALVEYYRNTNDQSVKHAAMQGMMISGHEAGLLELYQNAENLSEKRDLLQMLSITGGDAALEAIDSILDGEQL